MDDPSLPVRSQAHKIGRKGVLAAKAGVEDILEWIFREQPEDDYGIDAHLEVVAPGRRDLVTGQLIGMQIKGGQRQKYEAADRDGWYFYSTNRKSLNYWLGHSLPVIITLYDAPTNTTYWQVVRDDLVEYTEKGFKVFVPRAHTLDDHSRQALEDIARGTGQRALAVFDRSLERLPESVVVELRLAAELDSEGSARVAQVLADGSAQPGMTASHLLGAEPTWLTVSPAAEGLWAAVAGYAAAHLEHVLAARAFLFSADYGGPVADRRRALAGLSYFQVDDRDEARRILLSAATSDNARLLVAMGLAVLSLSAGDARAIETPPVIAAASDTELDLEPTVLNFLAENAQRRGEFDIAVGLMERAAASSRGTDPQVKVRLAEMLRRRMQAHGGFGGRDSRAAREYARHALEDMRRWGGPSHMALSELLDMEILDGTLRHVVRMALPAAAGGTATDREAATIDIARRGAVAALMERDSVAEEAFQQVLTGHPWLNVLAAERLELYRAPNAADDASAGGDDLKDMWLHALETADDDSSRSICASRLAELGVWPLPEAEDMLARSTMPSWIFQILQAKADAAQGRPEDAVRQLRLLAEDNATAAMELIRLLDRLGDPGVVRESELQYRRWHDGMLIDIMLHLSVPTPETDKLWDRFLDDPRLSPDTAAGLRRRVIRAAASSGDWQQVVDLCERGLASGTDDGVDTELAWQAAAAHLSMHSTVRARAVVTHYRLKPVSEDTARLWVRLRIGTDLTATDVQLAVELAERYGRTVAEPVSSLLVRESNRANRDGEQPWPDQLVEQVRTLVSTAQADGFGPENISEAELIRRLEQTDARELECTCKDAQAGQIPLARFASHAERPYGQTLVQRALGVTVAADAEKGLNNVGQAAAAGVLIDAGDAGVPVVADLSALYLLEVLADRGRDLRARLHHLCVTDSTKIDAIRTRDAVWTVTGASFTAGLKEGQLIKTTLAGAERSQLRTIVSSLEKTTTNLPHRSAGTGMNPAFDALALASESGGALYADDVALRQHARARGVPTFGTADLIAATNHPDLRQLLRDLAAAAIVDLPLDASDIIDLESRVGWTSGAGALTLSRSHWWERHEASWSEPWKAIAAAAVTHEPDALTTITYAALTGALAAVPAGQATHRYMHVVLAALEATHQASATPTPDYLTRIATRAKGGVAPSLKSIFHELRKILASQGDPDPLGTAASLLSATVDDPQLWT